MERGHGEDSQDRDRAGYSRYFWRSASDGDRQSHVAAAPERFGEEIVGRAAQARPVLHESDFRGGHRARVRGEDSSSKTDPAEAAANGGQDCIELGPTPVGAASVSLRDRILLTLDMTETFRPSCLQRKAAEVRQDQEVVANGSSTSRAGERPLALEAGVYGPFTGRLYFSQCTQAQWGEEEWLHPDGQLPQPGAEEVGRGVAAAEAEFSGAEAHDGDAGSDQGRGQRRARY